MAKESFPLIRTTAMAPVPGTVAGAQIVSSMLNISTNLSTIPNIFNP